MNSNQLKDWRVIIAAIILSGGIGSGGTAVFANSKPTRSEVNDMIADHRAIVILQEQVKTLTNRVERHHAESQDKLKEILRAINHRNGRVNE